MDCEVCGVEIPNPNYNQKYCSEYCRNRAEHYRKYRREWAKRNRDKDREAYNEYMRNFRKKNPEKFMRYEAKRYLKHKKWEEKHYRKLKEKIEKLIGNKCIVCNSTEQIHYHETYGKNHRTNQTYILNHHKDFVPMCRQHHVALHTLAKREGIEKFLELLRLISEDHF